ncbi:ECF transporter S component [Mycoplasmopsis primatum]|uniref:ECF transporter S component n=1 Tax=Mycoplasmopsis primatum TaxID=55604 RepID=UPI0004952D1F|nr:ECF transporter S component [Mycoplasmopsis primatum]
MNYKITNLDKNVNNILKIDDSLMKYNQERNQYSFWEKFNSVFKHPFKFSIMELVLSGFLLGFFILSYFLMKITGLNNLFTTEIFFCIIFGMILGPFKGSFIAFLADTLSLLISGLIGTWFWLYAIWPPIIAFISSLYFTFFKATKYAKIIVPFIVIISAITVMIVIYSQNVYQTTDGKIGINLQKYNAKKDKKINIPEFATIIGMVIYLALALMSTITISIFYLKNKSPKLLDYLLILSITTFVIVFYRWIFGPIVYIKYMNYLQNKNWTISDKYAVFAIPIVVKSMITLPVYVIILTSIYPVINILKDKHVNQLNQISY